MSEYLESIAWYEKTSLKGSEIKEIAERFNESEASVMQCFTFMVFKNMFSELVKSNETK
jgi:hypothetical protein